MPFFLFGAGNSVLDKTMSSFQQKYKLAKESFISKRAKLDKAYVAYTVQLAKQQILELEKIKLAETKASNIKSAISANDQIKFLNNAIKGNSKGIDISPMSPKVSKSMDLYTAKVARLETQYESKKKQLAASQKNLLSDLVNDQLKTLDRLEKILSKKGDLDTILILIVQREKLQAHSSDLKEGKEPLFIVEKGPAVEKRPAVQTTTDKPRLNTAESYISSTAMCEPGKTLDFSGDFTIFMKFKTTVKGNTFLDRKQQGHVVWALGPIENNAKWYEGALACFICQNGSLSFDHAYLGLHGGKLKVNDGEWHTVVVRDQQGSEITMYIDGQLQYKRKRKPHFAKDERKFQFSINADTGAHIKKFDGTIQNIRFVKKAWSDEQCKALSLGKALDLKYDFTWPKPSKR